MTADHTCTQLSFHILFQREIHIWSWDCFLIINYTGTAFRSADGLQGSGFFMRIIVGSCQKSVELSVEKILCKYVTYTIWTVFKSQGVWWKPKWKSRDAIRLKGLDHEVKQFFSLKFIVLGLTKNLYWFLPFKMVLWRDIVFAIFPTVKLKTYWRNNIYWRIIQNCFITLLYKSTFTTLH